MTSQKYKFNSYKRSLKVEKTAKNLQIAEKEPKNSLAKVILHSEGVAVTTSTKSLDC